MRTPCQHALQFCGMFHRRAAEERSRALCDAGPWLRCAPPSPSSLWDMAAQKTTVAAPASPCYDAFCLVPRGGPGHGNALGASPGIGGGGALDGAARPTATHRRPAAAARPGVGAATLPHIWGAQNPVLPGAPSAAPPASRRPPPARCLASAAGRRVACRLRPSRRRLAPTNCPAPARRPTRALANSLPLSPPPVEHTLPGLFPSAPALAEHSARSPPRGESRDPRCRHRGAPTRSEARCAPGARCRGPPRRRGRGPRPSPGRGRAAPSPPAPTCGAWRPPARGLARAALAAAPMPAAGARIAAMSLDGRWGCACHVGAGCRGVKALLCGTPAEWRVGGREERGIGNRI